MHKKDIKAQVCKQLKTDFPNWHSLTKKEKKGISQKVLDEVAEDYDYPKEIGTPVPELIGLADQQPTNGILTIDQMAKFVEAHQAGPLFKLYGTSSAGGIITA